MGRSKTNKQTKKQSNNDYVSFKNLLTKEWPEQHQTPLFCDAIGCSTGV